ncbi:MAG: rhodanese-like domain-containing protein [Candidatus Lambdaproteobacteria bacterium]|nr:rhodanese-like domain-containing protein [Candidatus Lambdaproteobacteria bacterium]
MKLRFRNPVFLLALAAAATMAVGFALLTGQGHRLGLQGSANASVQHVGPAEALALLRSDPKVVLVDVRTPQEFRAGHLKGALNVELDRLEALAPALLADRNAHLVVYCHSGNRSAFAVTILERMGYTYLVNMTGGIVAWARNGYPVTLE